MERLDAITSAFNKCTSIASELEKFHFVADSVKKYKVEPKKKKINYNLTSKESVKEDIKLEDKKSSLTEKDAKKYVKEKSEEKKEECPNVLLLGYNSKKEEQKKESVKEEKKFSSTEKEDKKSSESKITLQNRMECPVHVMTREEKDAKKKSKKEVSKDEEHRLEHLVHHLYENKMIFSEPRKMPTGLYETSITQINGNVIPISIDNDGLLYSDEIKFFIGHMSPGDEYEPTRPCFYMTRESLEALKQGQIIPEKYMVPQELFILNKLVDLASLKEKDPQKRSETFRNVSRIFTDKETFNAILKNANGESYRFAFCRYKSPDEFSLTSSGRNLLSNLSDEKQKVTREQWINFKNNKVDLKVKSRAK